jgi:sec-independent protein translocase protein TatA
MLPGATELMLILAVAALVFGAERITSAARSSGKAVGEYRKEREKLEQEIETVTGVEVGEDEEDADGNDDER